MNNLVLRTVRGGKDTRSWNWQSLIWFYQESLSNYPTLFWNLKSALGLNSLWPNHTIKHLRSWSIQIQAMVSCMTAPSHYLKQCGLIIKLINNVPWHLSRWIIIKYLKMPNSKMRLKLVCWDKFTPRPEIIHLFSSDDIFLHHGGKLIYLLSPSLILLASVHSRGTRYPPHVSFVTTPQGGNVPKTPVAWLMSQSHERLWPPLLKLKFGNVWWTSNKIWWLCLVPTSTTRFASEVGYRIAKIWHGYTRKIFFMNNDI